MNMITGFIEPTNGQIIINGNDISRKPKKAKKDIGYMPENVPLYYELTTKEFITYMAELKMVKRNERKEQVEKVIAEVGLEEVKNKFGALYTAFQYGAPPHAGIAPGIDRMLMLLSDSDTIREVIAFPLNSKAQDLMMGAPGNVKREQLRDVHIEIRD